MGTALLGLLKKEKLGGRGQGRLTQAKALQFQKYYRGAIVNNIGNAEQMGVAIWASLLHCMSTDDNPSYDSCPTSTESWCFYNKAVARDTDPPQH